MVRSCEKGNLFKKKKDMKEIFCEIMCTHSGDFLFGAGRSLRAPATARAPPVSDDDSWISIRLPSFLKKMDKVSASATAHNQIYISSACKLITNKIVNSMKIVNSTK